MAYEFVARKGLISSGSITLTTDSRLIIGMDSGSNVDGIIVNRNNGWSSMLLDAGLRGESTYKTTIVARRDYGQPFYIEKDGGRLIDTWEGGGGMTLPSIVAQNIRAVWQRLEIYGWYYHIHSSWSTMPAGIKLTSTGTGTTATDGLYMGLWTGSTGRLWNYESDGTWHIGTNNQTKLTVTTSSVDFTVPINTTATVTASAYNANGEAGWTGTININSTPPVAIYVQGGIITGVS